MSEASHQDPSRRQSEEYSDYTDRGSSHESLNDKNAHTSDDFLDLDSSNDGSAEDNTKEHAIKEDLAKKSMEMKHSMDRTMESTTGPFRDCVVESGPFKLGVMDALHMSIVLEDMSDQLDVIGLSIDAPQVDLRSEESALHDLAMHRPKLSIPPVENPYVAGLFSEKYLLLQNYTTIAQRRIQQMTGKTRGFREKLGAILSTYGVSKYSPKGKIQAERTQLNMIVDNLVTELVQSMTFNSLLDAVQNEKVIHKGMQEKVRKSIHDQGRIVESKRNIKAVRMEKKTELAKMQTAMWGIEDNTQEMLRRKELEAIYTKNCGKMLKQRIKKICTKNEDKIQKKLDDLTTKSWKYGIAHASMVTTLEAKHKEVQNRLEYWMDKYEEDKEQLQSMLDTMKLERIRDLERIDWLKHWIANYQEVVDDDRRIKDIFTKREKMRLCNIKMATRLQAWWKGTMVRKSLGPFNPKNMKKEPIVKETKNGKKDGKKKKK